MRSLSPNAYVSNIDSGKTNKKDPPSLFINRISTRNTILKAIMIKKMMRKSFLSLMPLWLIFWISGEIIVRISIAIRPPAMIKMFLFSIDPEGLKRVLLSS